MMACFRCYIYDCVSQTEGQEYRISTVTKLNKTYWNQC